jgi:hypothetical protein
MPWPGQLGWGWRTTGADTVAAAGAGVPASVGAGVGDEDAPHPASSIPAAITASMI